jgi:hypothetical protein
MIPRGVELGARAVREHPSIWRRGRLAADRTTPLDLIYLGFSDPPQR